MALSTQQQMLVEQRVTNESKSAVVAYLLWFFLGGLGAHRFYLGRSGSGIAMLVLFVLGWLTLAVAVGLFLLIAVGIWLLVDAFLIPGMVDNLRHGTRQQATNELLAMGGD
ncbi:TM2 domain-containing protein [Marimonas sp. MJW-29]|uniref:TM2 domain-containing protein n=1 Tax=Sulfitobacter sediminis TaxID=3234186 RepID=A0ABV3RS82_9RHOB